MFHRNLDLKLLALALAVFLWAYVLLTQRNPLMEASYSVPLQIRQVPRRLVVEDAPRTVDVTLRGLQKDLRALSASDLEVSVSLRGLGAGAHLAPVVLNTSGPFTVVQMRPQRVLLRLRSAKGDARALSRPAGQAGPR